MFNIVAPLSTVIRDYSYYSSRMILMIIAMAVMAVIAWWLLKRIFRLMKRK